MDRKMINYIVKGKNVFVGLEDSKRTWKVSVRCEGREIHYSTMHARYEMLIGYFRNKFPECTIKLIYEAGFKGFGLYDKLQNDGIECIVTPPCKVTQEKCNKVKTDKVDARRLATVLEKDDYKVCAVPDIERREDRQLCRAMIQVQQEITRNQEIRNVGVLPRIWKQDLMNIWKKAYHGSTGVKPQGHDTEYVRRRFHLFRIVNCDASQG